MVCAVKRANVIGAMDQRTTSGPTGVMTRIKQAEDMTAPTIKRNAAKKPLISGRHPDMTMPLGRMRAAIRSTLLHLAGPSWQTVQ